MPTISTKLAFLLPGFVAVRITDDVLLTREPETGGRFVVDAHVGHPQRIIPAHRGTLWTHRLGTLGAVLPHSDAIGPNGIKCMLRVIVDSY